MSLKLGRRPWPALRCSLGTGMPFRVEGAMQCSLLRRSFLAGRLRMSQKAKKAGWGRACKIEEWPGHLKWFQACETFSGEIPREARPVTRPYRARATSS